MVPADSSWAARAAAAREKPSIAESRGFDDITRTLVVSDGRLRLEICQKGVDNKGKGVGEGEEGAGNA